jgi:hypothetical protein
MTLIAASTASTAEPPAANTWRFQRVAQAVAIGFFESRLGGEFGTIADAAAAVDDQCEFRGRTARSLIANRFRRGVCIDEDERFAGRAPEHLAAGVRDAGNQHQELVLVDLRSEEMPEVLVVALSALEPEPSL